MSTRAEKALKAQKDKHHSILRELVQETPNKTCADCLAKGPRWASWNLGVFFCIRCAGIHRNLGVHISKVKSIDLDSWTQEQLEHFLKWGNKRAALYYECYLPKDFTRPTGNQAVETFIRNKYEKKLYTKKDGEPEPNSDTRLIDRIRNTTTSEKENKPPASKSKTKESKSDDNNVGADKTILNIAKAAPAPVAASVVQDSSTENAAQSPSINDLASVSPAEQPAQSCASTDDLLNFGAFSDPVPSTTENDPFQASTPSEEEAAENETAPTESAKSTKESILSLYASSGATQQKLYGVPGGVYMQQQQQQPQQQSQPQQQQQQMQSQVMPQQHMMQGNLMYGYQQQNVPNHMQQMNAQMQQMAINSNQMMSQQNFNQRPMSQFNSSGQQSYQQPIFGTNANMMSNQISAFQQQQKFQPQVGMPTGMMNMQGMNSGWMQQQQQQQPQQQQQQHIQMQPQQHQFPQSGHFSMNAGPMMNGNSGYTMNNQLWN